MIEFIEVKNFESLRDVRLKLGKYTAILGDSGVGKSALISAVNSLVFGIRGNTHVTVGEKYSTVTFVFPEFIVTFEKGEGRNGYKVLDRVTKENIPLEKVNKSIPEQIIELLEIKKVNIASQWDSPFFIEDSGAQVARVLGELTNVSVIFEAVKEGNRVRKELGTELKVRQLDLEEVSSKYINYVDLPSKLESLSKMESELNKSEDVAEKLSKLRDYVVLLKEEIYVFSQVKEYPSVPEIEDLMKTYYQFSEISALIQEVIKNKEILSIVNLLPVVPAVSDMMSTYDELTKLRENISGLIQNLDELKTNLYSIDKLSKDNSEFDENIHSLLYEAGKCPTCLQDVK